MAIANPNVNYAEERVALRATYVRSPPRHRLGVIRRRLAHNEIGPTRLVTMVSAVEALARSLVVHASTIDAEDVERIYAHYRNIGPENLVTQVLSVYRQIDAEEFFKDDTWNLFKEAVKFRNLIVHECTYLGQDKYPSMITASNEILDSLIQISNLGEE